MALVSYPCEVLLYILPLFAIAFQIRKGGVKGMLGVYPAQILEKQLGRRYNRKYKIYIRPSMEKYHSEHKTLEIVDWSRPATSASLNVCFILVFLACGLPFEVSKCVRPVCPTDTYSLRAALR